MSFSAHKRNALDATMAFNHRMSHLRSCAMLMGQKYGVPRSTVIEQVRQSSDVDITGLCTEADLQRAMTALVRIKESGLGTTATPRANQP